MAELTTKRPVSQARPNLRLYFDLPGIDNIDFGQRVTSAKFESSLNIGYAAKFNLNDPHFNTINKIIESGYFRQSRKQPVKVTFQLMASKDGGTFPRSATKEQIAYITHISAAGSTADTANLEFATVDPASYLLNKGSGSGKVYQGKVSNVIKQVISDYAQDIQLDISETTDSDKNRYWMMRQDPQSFIASLLEWSAPLTQNKTQWIVASDGMNLQIKEQADIKPRERGYYTFWEQTGPPSRDTIISWQLITDNSLSLSHTKLISQGLSTVSGAYLDKVTDQKEQSTVVKDSNTTRKFIANVDEEKAFTRPEDDEQATGISSVPTFPEIYSAGDIGLEYDQYIDGRARNLWLNLTRNLIKCKFRVLGHGEWSDGIGLGVDTIKILWIQAPGTDTPPKEWLLSGNWIVYGFCHELSRREWFTDLYAARFDFNSKGVPTPS